jgi:bacteriocin biosynthesis cyclodehydratase domain-containing protein
LLLVLELHQGGLSDDEEGPLPQRPLLAPWLRRLAREGELLLEYGDGIVALEGELAPVLALDGTRTLRELAPHEREVVATLAAEGVVVSGPAVADEDALREAAAGGVPPSLAARRLSTATIALVGAGSVAEEAARLLPGTVRRQAWDERPRGDLAVAAPESAELPLLACWNRQCLDAGQPWMLVLPYNGRFASVGPLFIPGETCCYACFVARRASALPDGADLVALEREPATYPVGRGLAAALGGLAATVAAAWIARADATAAGTFVALELEDGLRATRHRVFRVPRCDACSPAAEAPAPVPWASR